MSPGFAPRPSLSGIVTNLRNSLPDHMSPEFTGMNRPETAEICIRIIIDGGSALTAIRAVR